MTTVCWVNGDEVELRSDGSSTLLLALRNELGLKGTRFGCGAEECGACTVLIDFSRRRDRSRRRLVVSQDTMAARLVWLPSTTIRP